MNRLTSFKKFLSFICAAAISLGIASGSASFENAGAEEVYDAQTDYEQNPDNYTLYDDGTTADGSGDGTQQTDENGEQTTDGEQSDDSIAEDDESAAYGADLAIYAEQLQKISEKQKEINEKLDAANEDIKKEEEKQKLIMDKIEAVNDELDVLNTYMTMLEMKIATNERDLENKQEEITNSIADFKKRLRAMYIAGSDSYTDMVLQADDFYDVLMRLELIKRVAKHDDSMIDKLVKMKEEYEALEKELDSQKKEYETQEEQYNKQRQELTDLYASSKKAQAQLEAETKQLQKQNDAYDNERLSFEGSLGDVLKSTGTGGTARDNEILASMMLANDVLDELHKQYREKIRNKESIDEYEPDYYFEWPLPGNYNITYGVGPRWGSYHNGLDIMGNHGDPVHACESGVVIRTNTTCTHDYGKSESCGCGGGYGNFIIVDHGNGFITLYGHLSALDVTVGDRVKSGDIIGRMGSTGHSTGDHLHLEIRYNGYVLNPAYYVNVH